jgi:glycosyltransferase involved in cell wall biosynthesis
MVGEPLDPASGPLVSVIVPVFDGERFLADAVASVFAQDHRPLEVIVIDDGSADASGEVARSFDEVVLIEADHQGVAAARNLGLARATGAYITFLDADDLMAPGRLRTQLEHLRDHPTTGCVLMRQDLLIEPGAEHPLWTPDGPVAVPPTTAMIRQGDARRVGGFDPAYRVCEDTDWLFRLREAGVRIDVLPEVGLIRRIHGRNLTHDIDALRAGLARSVRGRLERARLGDRAPVA